PLAVAVGGLLVGPQLDAPDARPGEYPHRLDPEPVEVLLVVAEPPPPGVIEPQEDDPPATDELLQRERVVLRTAGRAGCFGRAVRVDREHLRGWLALVPPGVPVQGGQPVPHLRRLGLVRAEPEKRVALPGRGQPRAVALGQRAVLGRRLWPSVSRDDWEHIG